MSQSHGRFVWYELMTSNPAAAEAFYTEVTGCAPDEPGAAQVSYTMFTNAAPAEMNARPGWLGYVAVDDVDEGAARAVGGGGVMRRTPTNIPGIGRFAVISDPQGGTLALFKPVPGALDRRRTAGGVGWHELHAGDWKPAFQFYAGLFGWTAGEQHDLGKMGLYQLFARETEMIGGMMTKSASIPRPFWLFYFAVPSIEPAIIRMRQAGGEVLNGPHQVPGGSWIAQCVDPQGGLFALAAPSSGSG